MTVIDSHGSCAAWAPAYDVPSWRDDAACKNQTFYFFDDATKDIALSICAACPVVDPCLDDALTRNDECVQGGMTFEMRKREKRRRRRGEPGALHVRVCEWCGTKFISTQPKARWCPDSPCSEKARNRRRNERRKAKA